MKNYLLTLAMLTTCSLSLANECKVYSDRYAHMSHEERVEHGKLLAKKGYTLVESEAEADLQYITRGYLHGEYGALRDEQHYSLQGNLNGRKVDINVKVMRSPMNIPGIIFDHFLIVKRKIKSCAYLQKKTRRGQDVMISFKRVHSRER